MGKTVLITGCSSGIGRAAATLFCEKGWNVAATMREPSKWTGSSGQAIKPIALDVTDPSSIEVALGATVEAFGQLDCVVNNAGGGLFSVFEATPMEMIRENFELNVFGAIQLIQAALPHFVRAGAGRVVNIASGSGIVPEPLMAGYGAAKCALEGFSEGVRYELQTRNVVVKVVEPGFIPGTNFVQRAQETSHGISVPPSYGAYIEQRMAVYLGEQTFTPSTDEDVAAAIYEAATTDSDQFRYPVGADVEEMAHMRRETSEIEYNRWTLERFSPRS